MIDKRTVAQLKEKDEHAIAVWMKQSYRYYYSIVYSIIKHPLDTEDVLQEVFVKILQSMDTFHGDEFKAWSAKIAVHEAIDYKRKLVRVQDSLTKDDAVITFLASEETVEKQVLTEEKRQFILASLRKLPSDYRFYVMDFYLKGLSYEEIAKKRNVEKKNVEMKLYRARSWLRKYWQKEVW